MIIQCGTTGQAITVQTVGSGGNVQSEFPTFNARTINLSMVDVQQTIQEGRMSGTIKPFNISGGTDLKN